MTWKNLKCCFFMNTTKTSWTTHDKRAGLIGNSGPTSCRTAVFPNLTTAECLRLLRMNPNYCNGVRSLHSSVLFHLASLSSLTRTYTHTHTHCGIHAPVILQKTLSPPLFLHHSLSLSRSSRYVSWQIEPPYNHQKTCNKITSPALSPDFMQNSESTCIHNPVYKAAITNKLLEISSSVKRYFSRHFASQWNMPRTCLIFKQTCSIWGFDAAAD